MSVTSEKFLKSVEVIFGEEEKKEAEKRLKELGNKLQYPDRYGPDRLVSVLNYYAQEMPKYIMKIFLKNKLEPMTRETVFKKLKEETTSWWDSIFIPKICKIFEFSKTCSVILLRVKNESIRPNLGPIGCT